jgi:nicotinate phosphoribosyltransferase
MAHSFITGYGEGSAGPDELPGPPRGDVELEALRSFARHAPTDPVLLVDTYDSGVGIAHAVTVGLELRAVGRHLAGIRLDSGDLVALSRQARAALDDAGLADTAIFASGGIDEYEIHRLVDLGVPIDGFGVGTRFGVSEDVPVLETVYKLVEVGGRPVAKHSPGKATLPGAKQAWRQPRFAGDVVALTTEGPPGLGAEPLLGDVPLGAPRGSPARVVAAAGACFEADWYRCPPEHKALTNHTPYQVILSSALSRLAGDCGSG